MPEQPTPTPVAPPPEEPQRADPLASAVAEAVAKLRRTAGLSERAAEQAGCEGAILFAYDPTQRDLLDVFAAA